MTEHILNFAIGIEDDAIRKMVEDRAAKEIVNELKVDIMKALFTKMYYGDAVTIDENGQPKLTKDAVLKDFARQLFKEAMESYKDEIIEKGVKELVRSYRNSKAWKDKVGEVDFEKI